MGGETTHLNGAIVLRPDEKGRFDELLMMDGAACVVHFEMLDDGHLYIGLYPKDQPKSGMQVWIRATKGGKIKVTHEDYSWLDS